MDRQGLDRGPAGPLRDARDPREALEAEAAAIRQRRRPGRTTVAGFAGRWKRDYKRPRASTNRTNAVMISTFVEEFGTRRLSSIDRLEARAWAQANPSRARTVRAMFNDAIDAGLVTQNPFARLGLEQSRGRRDLVVLSVMSMLGSQGCANKHSTTASSRPSEAIAVASGAPLGSPKLVPR